MTTVRMVSASVCMAGVVLGGWLTWQDPEQPPVSSNRPFMQAKLDLSKEIVEGLALENYDRLEASAQNLFLLSQESAWNVVQAPEYLGMSAEFRGSVSRLKEAAHARNIDGATLAWFEVTLNCVRCHKYLRQKTHSQPVPDSPKPGGG